jgi:hypothetical protein
MQALRMFVGTVVLAGPTLSFLIAFGGALPWATWGALTLVSTAIGATMSYYRLPLPTAEDAVGYGDI